MTGTVENAKAVILQQKFILLLLAKICIPEVNMQSINVLLKKKVNVLKREPGSSLP